jgi:hypothetical protein
VDVSNITNLSYDPNNSSEFGEFGGIVLDTGSLATYLREPLHSRFLDVFVPAMKSTTNVYPDSYDAKSGAWLDSICYTFKNDVNVSNIQIPSVVINLDENVDLHLGSKNIFFISKFDERSNQRTLCLAFLKGTIKSGQEYYGPRILGSISQQIFYVEIDIENKKVGFAQTKCKTL